MDAFQIPQSAPATFCHTIIHVYTILSDITNTFNDTTLENRNKKDIQTYEQTTLNDIPQFCGIRGYRISPRQPLYQTILIGIVIFLTAWFPSPHSLPQTKGEHTGRKLMVKNKGDRGGEI